VDLPTYAFQRRRYWSTDSMSAAQGDSSAHAAGPADGTAASSTLDADFWDAVERGDSLLLAEELDVPTAHLGAVVPALAAWRHRRQENALLDSWRYQVTWTPAPAPATPAAAGAPAPTWLLVRPPAAANDTLARLSDALATEAQLVSLEVTDPDRAELAASLRTVLAETAPVRILSLLGLDDRPHPQYPALTRGGAATVVLAQALQDAEATAPLWCVTSGAVAVHDSAELLSPHQAALWGLGASLALDQPQSFGGMIDVPAAPDAQTARHLGAVLRAEADEDQLAVRPDGVFARRMVRSPLTAAPAPGSLPHHRAPASDAAPAPVSDAGPVTRPAVPAAAGAGQAQAVAAGGTVLITGGTGGLGAHVARLFARNGARHLVLTSRRGPAAQGAAALKEELEGQGVQVTVAACDVADRDALAALLDSLPKDPPLRAVVHAAGLPQRIASLPELDLEEFAEVGRAKILGALHLDDLLADRPLDAFVLFSSGSAVWGSGGQAAYGSANAFLDGLAHRRQARGRTATCVAWGSWEGGMVDAELSALMRRMGAPAMAPATAVNALEQALEQGQSHLVVADFDWSRFVPAYTLARPRPLIADIPDVRAALAADSGPQPDASTAPQLAAQLAGLPQAEQSRTVQDLVRSHTAALLGYDDPAALDLKRAFDDLGFDSVSAVDLRGRLSTATGRKLPSTMVFDYASPAALAQFLLTELAPDTAPGPLPLLAQLERLEAAAAGLDPQEIEADRLVARLQSLTARLTDIVNTESDAASSVGQKLQTASADDVFDFIDKELGLT
jgi:NAD(P)-dependent dehydrogenase (short-subunit alcohol dehydrogenase family)/acyl carrier protein